MNKRSNRPLEEDEAILKKGYRNRTKSLWETPMTFAQYEKYLEDGMIVESPLSYIYKEYSKNGLGNTMEDLIGAYNVEVLFHRRYSYPVLHNHDYVEMIYVLTGECEHFFEDTSFHMGTGDVCILAPNTFHALSCTNDESCILNILMSKNFFNQNFLQILRGRRLISEFIEDILYHRRTSPYILFPTGEDVRIQELANRMLMEEKQKRYAYRYSIRLLASEFLLHIIREYEVTAIVPNKKDASQNDLILAVLAYLSVNYNCTTLAKTAQFFGYSQEYLSRTIHENVGKTYKAIISELQMEHAAELLKESDLSFTEIAQEVGCFDSSHFSKKFKAVYGISPREYRNSI